MRTLINYLIFPGFVFTLVVGGLGWWFERKLTARFQYRVGPPWYQNFIDIAKLFLKEQIIPSHANRVMFIISPIITFSSVAAVSFLLNQSALFQRGFWGDIFVVLYLLIIPSLFIIIGGFSSSNPLATVGAVREVKLMLAYEFVFISTLIIVIIKSGTLSIAEIIRYQSVHGALVRSIPGVIGFLLSLIYLQAKLGLVPFDVSEAEQEIMGGVLIEYSGPLLGLYKISRALLYFSMPLFVIILFWGGSLGWHLVYKYPIILLIMAVIKNTNPRLRVNDILKLFWLVLFPLGCLGIVGTIIGW